MQKIRAKCTVYKQQCMLFDETVYCLMKHLTQVLKLLKISDKTNKQIYNCMLSTEAFVYTNF